MAVLLHLPYRLGMRPFIASKPFVAGFMLMLIVLALAVS